MNECVGHHSEAVKKRLEAFEVKNMDFAYAVALLTSSPQVKIETEIEEYYHAAEEEDVSEENQ